MNDLISRRKAIETVEKESQVDGAYGYMDTKSIVDLLNDLPSVQPEQKHGKWIRLSNVLAQCSECKDYIDNAISCGYNYCPNCGAKMDMERK